MEFVSLIVMCVKITRNKNKCNPGSLIRDIFPKEVERRPAYNLVCASLSTDSEATCCLISKLNNKMATCWSSYKSRLLFYIAGALLIDIGKCCMYG